jgi:hypothetical protein
VQRVLPIHLVILGVAVLGAVFAFVAMRVAFDARDAARSADSGWGGDNSAQLFELQQALVRAGVIEDPSIIPDDGGELDGPWARCLTSDEREALGPAADDVELPPACDVVTVAVEERCEGGEAAASDGEVEADDVADAGAAGCERVFEVDGRRYGDGGLVHPADVAADEWLLADGDGEVDRVARGSGDVWVHVIDEGWVVLYRD